MKIFNKAGFIMYKYERASKIYNLKKSTIIKLLEKEVFSTEHFNEHVKEVSLKTKIDERIVKDVLKSYFTNIVFVMNRVLKIKTKINIYGFLDLIIGKGSRF